MPEDYETLFRSVGTAEGEFHAIFASRTESVRERIRRFAAERYEDREVMALVERLTTERQRLWQAWRRGLRPELRALAARVEEHHSPDPDEPPDFETFLKTYAEVDGSVRATLEGFSQAHPRDRGAESFIQGVLGDLDQVGDALNEFTGQGRA